MHNGYVLAFDIVHDHFPHARRAQQIAVPEKEQISALKGRLHRSRQHHHDRRRRVGHHREPFPHHKRRREDEAEIEYLRRRLAGILQRRQHGEGVGPDGRAERSGEARREAGQMLRVQTIDVVKRNVQGRVGRESLSRDVSWHLMPSRSTLEERPHRFEGHV